MRVRFGEVFGNGVPSATLTPPNVRSRCRCTGSACLPPPFPHPTRCRTLPRLQGDAMRRDLEPDWDRTDQLRDLLRPLAFAEGQGLPWEDIWAPLGSGIARVNYTDDDLLWLRHHAGSYVVEAIEANRSAYRLYHQALAEHLREDADDTSAHHAFTQVLRSRVPLNPDGSRDWARTPLHPATPRNTARTAVSWTNSLPTPTAWCMRRRSRKPPQLSDLPRIRRSSPPPQQPTNTTSSQHPAIATLLQELGKP